MRLAMLSSVLPAARSRNGRRFFSAGTMDSSPVTTVSSFASAFWSSVLCPAVRVTSMSSVAPAGCVIVLPPIVKTERVASSVIDDALTAVRSSVSLPVSPPPIVKL
jgi:hypothetical protein